MLNKYINITNAKYIILKNIGPKESISAQFAYDTPVVHIKTKNSFQNCLFWG